MANSKSKETSEITIIYDGDCPVCSRYVTHLRLRQSFGSVVLIDARKNSNILIEMNALNLDLDEGMVVKANNQIHHGDNAINVLALMSTRSGIFNKINSILFSHPGVSKAIYPIMRFGRSCLLRVLGKSKLSD